MEAEATKNTVPTYSDTELIFKYFPGFARFIRENHLISYINEQIDLCIEYDLPIMKHVQHIPREQLLEIGIPSHTEFLTNAENNTLKSYIRKNLKIWDDDEIGFLGRNDVATEDITTGTHIRNRALLKILPLYTNDPFEIIEIVKEIDAYSTENITAATHLHFKILTESINKHAHFIERITNTSPGAIYVYDLDEKKEIYSNNKMFHLLGYTAEEIALMGENITPMLVHPDDLDVVYNGNEELLRLKEGEISTIDCRSLHKNGHYIWLRNHRSAFKWDNDGVVKQIIGITLNVDEEKKNEEKLKQNEEQLLEAQKLVSLGSFTLNLETEQIDATPEFYNIYEISEDSYNRKQIADKIHPADISRVTEARDKAIEENGIFDSEYRYITDIIEGREKVIWARGVIFFKDGQKMMKGTVMDVTERKHIIQRLQRSELLYKQAQAMSHIGNWTWDLLTETLNWSDELYRIHGLQPGTELTNELVRSLIHPNDIQEIRKVINTARITHEPYDMYYKLILQTGEIRIVQAKGSVLVDSNGVPYKMVGTVQDVTERQTLIENLQKSEERYKQAQAMAHIGNWEWYVQEDKIEWTDEMYRIYGFDRTEDGINYDKFISHIHPDDRYEMQETVRNCIVNGEPYDIFHRIITDNGEIKCLHGKGDILFGHNGEVVKLYGTAQDITKEYEAEQRIKASSEFIKKIANTTPSLLASYNVNTGKYTFLNKAFEKVLGYDNEQIFAEGMSFFMDIVHPDDLGQIMEKNSLVLAEANSNPPADGNEMIAEFEYRMKNKEGNYRWFYTYGTIFDRNSEGKVEHVLNVSVDITEQKEAKQALDRKNIELLHSNASLEEFAYVASHDLKEPLRKISTFGDLISANDRALLSDDGKMYLDKIISSSKRMQAMINDLMSLSVISGNKAYEKTDLNEVLSEAMGVLEYNIKEKNASVTYDTLPTVNIVRSQFVQVFQNLLSNALKFSSFNINPAIHVSSSYINHVEAANYGLADHTRYLKIEISDNGIGFDQEYANRIFTIFQRLHGKSDYEGNGIGLSICRKVVENHKGTIFATGIPGKGAIFTIVIPS